MKWIRGIAVLALTLAITTVALAEPLQVLLVKVGIKGGPSGVIPLIYVIYGDGKPLWRDITTLPANVTIPSGRLNGYKVVKVKLITLPEYVTLPPRAKYELVGNWIVTLKVEVPRAPYNYTFTFKLVKAPPKVRICVPPLPI
ncbi:MAG: hypothetical protein B6U69_03000 [Thermofilum sp. ex4484_15]|nr:MAG: hypothetical protein B6U69_03000 [Thermofilum sp. ex4484_15]